MHERYRIREGVSGDVASVVALDRATELLPHWPESEYTRAVDNSRDNELIAGVKRRLFVAETAAKIVGFCLAKVTVLPDEVLAELESVAVAATDRRGGVGKALCEATIAWSRREGATQMDLEVRSTSKGAIHLYQALGFAASGKRSAYYRNPVDDAILMRIYFDGMRQSGSRGTNEPEQAYDL